MANNANVSEYPPTQTPRTARKSYDILTCTVRAPPYSYVHVELSAELHPSSPLGVDLDALQVRSLCTAALRQFLGATGVAIPVDVLLVKGAEAWIRVPREDLGKFTAGITSWAGAPMDLDESRGAERYLLRLKGCSDWLGSMVARDGQASLWRPCA